MHTFEQYLALLQRYARRFVCADEDAEDLAHECLHAYRRRYGAYPWETEETAPSPIRWCLRKIHALAIDHYRRSHGQHETTPLDSPDTKPPAEVSPERELLMRCALEEFVNTLPPYLREVAMLYEEGYSYKEIAEMLGVAVGTVQGYIARIGRLGREFFGIDDNKTAVGVVNTNRGLEKGFSVQEVCDDTDETAALADDGCSNTSDSKSYGNAQHARRSQRTSRGGGGR